jgi:hypothetical protein
MSLKIKTGCPTRESEMLGESGIAGGMGLGFRSQILESQCPKGMENKRRWWA